MSRLGWLLGILCLLSAASGQATLPVIDVKAIAEVRTKSTEDGHEIVRLGPADRVVPGDLVIYTLEIRNAGATDVIAPVVTRPIPDHMTYVADSATGPGAEVTYSIDGGRTFARADALKSVDTDGHTHRAIASDYTHIRWQLKNTLKSKSVAFARFRAVVK